MAKESNKEELIDNLALELRRGALVLAVLSRLGTPRYGYALKQTLTEMGLDINEGTLYPLLRRLEKQGLLASEWEVVDDTRPRRYYKLSPMGKQVLASLTGEWSSLVTLMNGFLAVPPGGK